MSPWLPLSSVPQNLRVGRNLYRFVSVKVRNLHAGQVIDDKLTCSKPSTFQEMQAYGIKTIFPLPRNLAHFLIMVFLRKTKQNFLKGQKIPSHHNNVALMSSQLCFQRDTENTYTLFLTNSCQVGSPEYLFEMMHFLVSKLVGGIEEDGVRGRREEEERQGEHKGFCFVFSFHI